MKLEEKLDDVYLSKGIAQCIDLKHVPDWTFPFRFVKEFVKHPREITENLLLIGQIKVEELVTGEEFPADFVTGETHDHFWARLKKEAQEKEEYNNSLGLYTMEEQLAYELVTHLHTLFNLGGDFEIAREKFGLLLNNRIERIVDGRTIQAELDYNPLYNKKGFYELNKSFVQDASDYLVQEIDSRLPEKEVELFTEYGVKISSDGEKIYLKQIEQPVEIFPQGDNEVVGGDASWLYLTPEELSEIEREGRAKSIYTPEIEAKIKAKVDQRLKKDKE